MRNFVARIKKREFEPEDLAFADEYSRAFLAEEHLEGKEVKALMNKLLEYGGDVEKRQVEGLLKIPVGPPDHHALR